MAAAGLLAAGEARARLFEEFLTLLERLAEQRPLVLVVEDAHWADRSSRDLIAFLIAHPDQVFTRTQLLSAVWGHTFTGARTVDVHVRRLRAKLDPDRPLITTLRGIGYRLAPGVSVAVAAPAPTAACSSTSGSSCGGSSGTPTTSGAVSHIWWPLPAGRASSP